MSGTKEVCPTCVLLGLPPGRIRRLQPIATERAFCASGHRNDMARWQYRCGRGHEFSGEQAKLDPCETCQAINAKVRKEFFRD